MGCGITVVCALSLAVVSCGRTAEEGSDAGGQHAGGASGSVQAGGASANANAGNSDGGTAGSSGAAGSAAALTALSGELRRLTSNEYAATVSDVLGTSVQPDLTAFSTEVDGFDNNAAANGVSDDLYLRYLETAERLASEVFGSDTLRAKIVICAATDDTACVRQVITQTGLRVFRRPVLEDEIATYQKVYVRARARAEDHEGALQEVLTALLASAQFLFRTEFVPEAAGVQPVSQYDLASRLSYLLWSSAPDAPLLAAAEQGALSTDEQLADATTRLLEDPRASRLTQNFAGQWLGVRKLPAVSLNPFAFEAWTPEVATAAANEVEAYFAEFLNEDRQWPGFLDSRAHFVTPELAAVYGLTVQGTVAQRVELPGVDRQGFLGLVGFLAQSSVDLRGVPSGRGAWIARQLLCSALPAPPMPMPAFVGGESSIGAALGAINADPQCAACHAAIDPLGLALENYDAIGRYRTAYGDAVPIPSNVKLQSAELPAGLEVSGISGLSQALASAPAFSACAAQKLYTYGFGRAFAESERANVQLLAEQWRSGRLTLRELILHLVQSAAFRSRSDGGSL